MVLGQGYTSTDVKSFTGSKSHEIHQHVIIIIIIIIMGINKIMGKYGTFDRCCNNCYSMQVHRSYIKDTSGRLSSSSEIFPPAEIILSWKLKKKQEDEILLTTSKSNRQ